MENKKTNEPIQIFVPNSTNPNLSDVVKSAISHPSGLTKREYFAAMAMQGLLANNKSEHKYCVISAVEYADDLIEVLNKPLQNYNIDIYK